MEFPVLNRIFGAATRPQEPAWKQINPSWLKSGVKMDERPEYQKFMSAPDFVAFTKSYSDYTWADGEQSHHSIFRTAEQMRALLNLPSVRNDPVGFAEKVIHEDSGLKFDIQGDALKTLLAEIAPKSPQLAAALKKDFELPFVMGWKPAGGSWKAGGG